MPYTKRKVSPLEEAVEGIIRIFGLPPAEREFRFEPSRRWRFDFAWPYKRLALEVEGGIWIQGRHTRGKAFISDCDKYNTAALLGWKVLRVTDAHIKQQAVLPLLQRALEPEPLRGRQAL